MSQSDLARLMREINDRYPFTAKQYPVIDRLAPSELRAFVVSHLVHHASKSLGKISAECEAADHGEKMDEEALFTATTKILINALQLATHLGLTANDLIQMVPACMKSNETPKTS